MSSDSSRNKFVEASVITIVAHPAERWRPRPTVKAQAGPCCCCCCCLHTVGALIGAAVVPLIGARPQSESFLKAMQDWDQRKERKAPTLQDGERVAVRDAYSPETPENALSSSEDQLDIALPPKGSSAVQIFWLSLLVLIVPGYFSWLGYDRGLNGVTSYIFILIMFLPGFQIAALTVTALILGFSSRTDKLYQMGQACKIFLGVVVGTVLGIFAMILMLTPR